MSKSHRKLGIAILIAAAAAVSQTACVGYYPYSSEVGVRVGTGYYTPRYYDGYLVYYDDFGAPFYYRGSSVYYVPRSYRGYGDLRSHYRRHRSNYHRWYDDRGYRFRNYRPPREDRRPPPVERRDRRPNRDWDRPARRDPFGGSRERSRVESPFPSGRSRGYDEPRSDRGGLVTTRRTRQDRPADSGPFQRQETRRDPGRSRGEERAARRAERERSAPFQSSPRRDRSDQRPPERQRSRPSRRPDRENEQTDRNPPGPFGRRRDRSMNGALGDG